MKEANENAILCCLFLSQQLPIKPTYLQRGKSDPLNLKSDTVAFLKQLNKDFFQTYPRSDFPPTAGSISVPSQPRLVTKNGWVRMCTMTTLLSNNVFNSYPAALLNLSDTPAAPMIGFSNLHWPHRRSQQSPPTGVQRPGN